MRRTNIDWDSVRSRLQASERALEGAMAESPERIEIAYRERALRLAKRQVEHGHVSGGLPVLVFRLAQERYAIELKDVAEVIPFTRCTPVPGAPPHFAGVISLRGELRAVLDLGRLLAVAESADRDSRFVLMLRRHGQESRQGQEIGLKVDRIEELGAIQREELSTTAPGNYVKGIAPGTLMLLSVDAVLAGVFSTGVLTT
jgi:chemotaxis signal transduction protein